MSHRWPTSRVVRGTYNRIAEDYAGLYEGPGPLAHFYRTRLELVGELLGQKPAGVVLDVGAGAGIVGDVIRDLGFRYVAADLSVGMARECQSRPGSEGAVAVATVTALPFASGAFDVVTALGVIEYVHPPQGALRECRRVLRHKGTFLISLLNRSSPFRLLQSARRGLGLDPDPIPPAHFSRRKAQRLVAAAGFTIQSVRYFDFELLPLGLAQQHPKWSECIAAAAEVGHVTPLRWLGSAFLVEAQAV